MAAALAPSLLPTGDRISGGGPKRRGQAPLINQINCVGKSAAVTISKRLGHSSPDVTLRIYAHLFHKDDRKAAAAINAALGQ